MYFFQRLHKLPTKWQFFSDFFFYTLFFWLLNENKSFLKLFFCSCAFFQVRVAPYLGATASPVRETNLWFSPLCPQRPMHPHLQRCITNLPGTNCLTKGFYTSCKSQKSKKEFLIIEKGIDMRVICDLSLRQLGDALKKNEQTHKDAEFYHAEAESIRTR